MSFRTSYNRFWCLPISQMIGTDPFPGMQRKSNMENILYGSKLLSH